MACNHECALCQIDRAIANFRRRMKRAARRRKQATPPAPGEETR